MCFALEAKQVNAHPYLFSVLGVVTRAHVLVRSDLSSLDNAELSIHRQHVLVE